MAKVLLGFMGVGKSSVAPYLDGRFVDMDQVCLLYTSAQSLDILSEHGTIIASTNAANMTVQQFKKQLRKGLGDVSADFVNLQQLPADFTVNPNDSTSNYLKVYTIKVNK